MQSGNYFFELLELFVIGTLYHWVMEFKYHIIWILCLDKGKSAAKHYERMNMFLSFLRCLFVSYFDNFLFHMFRKSYPNVSSTNFKYIPWIWFKLASCFMRILSFGCRITWDRCVFRILSNVYDGTFLWKQLKTSSC